MEPEELDTGFVTVAKEDMEKIDILLGHIVTINKHLLTIDNNTDLLKWQKEDLKAKFLLNVYYEIGLNHFILDEEDEELIEQPINQTLN